MLKRLFKTRPAVVAGRSLYAATVPQSRLPALYADYGVPDTPEGRFEIYSLHVYLILERLKNQGDMAAETAQVLFDTYVSSLDNALRELGVGDMAVSKRMRKLGEAFYGRVKSLEVAIGALPDREPLEKVLSRTAFADVEDAAERSPRLATYLLAQRDALAALPTAEFCSGHVQWIAP